MSLAWRWPWRGVGAEPQRWVVVDVETTGLDPSRDALLAVAAVAVHRQGDGLTLPVADSFEAQLLHEGQARPEAARANALVHGIGLGQQRAGADPAQVLRAFADFVDGAPLLGFHVGFDRQVLQRAWAQHLGRSRSLAGPWIDIETLAAASVPGHPRGALDDWLQRFGIECAERHQAVADTAATAELLMCLWPRVRACLPPSRRAQGTVPALVKLERDRRWLAG